MAIAEDVSRIGQNDQELQALCYKARVAQDMEVMPLHSMKHQNIVSEEDLIDDIVNTRLRYHSPHSLTALVAMSLHVPWCLNSKSFCDASSTSNQQLVDKTFLQNAPCYITTEGFLLPNHLGSDGLGECFGVAMAACALGLLQSACFESTSLSSGFQKRATPCNRGANMVPLALTLHEHFEVGVKENTECAEAHGSEESSNLLQKLEDLQSEVLELRKLRSEDGKANERVVSIFASKEQAWNIERKNLRSEQRELCQELQRAFLQQEGLRMRIEQLKNIQKLPCPDCEHKEVLCLELKARLEEQDFLIMATMEEAQVEQQEKDTLAEKLTCAESSLSQLWEKLSVEAERHSLELVKLKESLEQLESRLNEVELEKFQVLKDLEAAQSSLSALTHEKNCQRELISKMSSEITQLQQCTEEKEVIITAMRKKAIADLEDRQELEKELAVIKATHFSSEREKEKWRWLMDVSSRANKTKIFKARNSFEGRPEPTTADIIEELQKLHDIEMKSMQSAFEAQVQILQKRLGNYQERVADLEEDVLSSMATTKVLIPYKEEKCSNHGELVSSNCVIVLKETMEAELASKQFQLSVAKDLVKQYRDTEQHREQEIEKWKNLYLASKATLGMLSNDKQHAGAIVPKNPRFRDWLEVEKCRHAYRLEQKHCQELDAFERQMKARDERMEAFRQQLLRMEDEAQRRNREIESLKRTLAAASDDKRRLEELIKRKEEAIACKDKALVSYSVCSCVSRKMCSLRE